MNEAAEQSEAEDQPEPVEAEAEPAADVAVDAADETPAEPDADEAPTEEAADEAPAEIEKATDAQFCTACGNPVQPGQAFCSRCGTKVESPMVPAPVDKTQQMPAAAEIPVDAVIEPAEKKALAEDKSSDSTKEVKVKLNKKTLMIAAIAAAAVIVAIIVAIIVVPDMVATPQELLEQDKYEKAYEKASDDQKNDIFTGILDDGQYEIAFKLAGDDEKLQLKAIGCAIGLNHFDWAYANAPTDDMKMEVLAANAAATAIPEIQGMAKDGSSVRLTEAYYMYDSSRSGDLKDALVMKIAGSNSYGQTVQNYYVSNYESGSKDYEYYNSVSDMDDDTFYSFDSYSEKLEKLFDNLTRDYIRDVLSDSDTVEVPSAFIDGINKLIEDGRIDEVELINGGSVSDGGVTA
jgi:hypothetical protein